MSQDRRQRRFAETRRRLDEAGRALLGSANDSDVSLLMITEYADVSHATFYSHFESKGAFIASLRHETNAVVSSGVVASFEMDPDAPTALARMVRAMFRQVVADSSWATFALSTHADFADFGDPIDVAFLENLEAGIEQGCYLDVGDRESTVLSLRSSLRAGVRFSIDRGSADDTWAFCLRHALSMLGVESDLIDKAISSVAPDDTAVASPVLEPSRCAQPISAV
ncbi:MAG: TetR/AcrR family transcriptional regulator [Actinobacteria bacterium]|nr:TetR/AcrR family transcriptional regulator [Actinomycetota bacterium]